MPIVFAPLNLAADAVRATVSTEYRARYERHTDPSFTSAVNDNRSDLLQRVRVGTTVHLAPNLKATAQYQYAQTTTWTGRRNFSDDGSDLLVGNLTYSSKPFEVVVGRQKLVWGEGRLIGTADWANLSRTFDAVAVHGQSIDAFAGRVGVSPNRPVNARIAGAQARTRFGETSLIYKQDSDATHDVRLTTLDHRIAGALLGNSYTVEAAAQGGRSSGRDQEAWAYFAEVTRPISPTLTLGIETTAASGGGDATKSRTFDSLYPSPHRLYGLSDTTGWSNMTQFGASLRYVPSRSTTVSVRWLNTELRDSSEAWTNASGGVNSYAGNKFVDPTGQSGRGIGQELDIEASHTLHQGVVLTGGVAWLRPGSFIKNKVGDDRSLFFGYVQLNGKF